MNDPYKILGVPRDASDDEIKKVYRSLSRKFHPDANVNNPNQEAAEAKFKEVQQAYQQIMDERTNGYRGQSSYGGNPYGQSGGGSPYGDFGGFGDFWGFGGNEDRQRTNYGGEDANYYQAATNYIRNGHYREALNVLNQIKNRNAQWYYLSGYANYGVGNNAVALEHAKRALQIEPDNLSYRELVHTIESGGDWYQSRRSPYGGTVMTGNNCCMRLCIANMICNLCCGGGFCCGSPGVYYC